MLEPVKARIVFEPQGGINTKEGKAYIYNPSWTEAINKTLEYLQGIEEQIKGVAQKFTLNWIGNLVNPGDIFLINDIVQIMQQGNVLDEIRLANTPITTTEFWLPIGVYDVQIDLPSKNFQTNVTITVSKVGQNVSTITIENNP